MIKRLIWYMKNDPVKKCDLYKDKGCAHVDGMLCDFPTCSMYLEYIKRKGVKMNYFLFRKYYPNISWEFMDEFINRKSCEKAMELLIKDSSITYKIIKGIELEWEGDMPRYPFIIRED